MLKLENNFEYYCAKNHPKKLSKPVYTSFPSDAIGAQQFANAMKEYEEQKIEYDNAIKKYNENQNKLIEEFKKDLEEYYCTDKLPKEIKDAIYEYAYEEGHAYGFSDIFSVYGRLTGIIDAIQKHIK